MLKGIAKAIAYFKAPVKTYSFLHPLKAAKWAGIFFVVRAVMRRSTRKHERASHPPSSLTPRPRMHTR